MAGLPGGGMPPMGGAYPPGQQGLEGPNPLSQAMVAAQAVQNLGAQIDREKKRMENEVTEVRRPAPAPPSALRARPSSTLYPPPAVVEPTTRSRSRDGAGLDAALPLSSTGRSFRRTRTPAPGRSPSLSLSLPPPRHHAPED